jgi:hypothetical protein
VGFAPTEKRRLLTAHANNGLMHRSKPRRYSITSLAATCKVSGTLMPSALAVLRLMTRSYLVSA